MRRFYSFAGLVRIIAVCTVFWSGTLLSKAQEVDTVAGPPFNGPVRLEAGEEGEEEQGDREMKEEPGLFPDLLKQLQGSWIEEFNRFGSFNYMVNGIALSLNTKAYDVDAAYGYMNESGYRDHSDQYGHRFSFGIGTAPAKNTSLKISGRYSSGRLKMPGSLTKSEFGEDAFQADPRSVNRDEKCISSDGDLAVLFNVRFGHDLYQLVEVRAYGGIEYMERATREYMIVNGHELGLNAHYSWTALAGRHRNTLVAAGDLLMLPERTEYYDNMGGTRGDLIEQLMDERSSRAGLNILDTFEIVPEKLLVGIDGRYEYTEYNVSEMTLPSRSEKRVYSAFIPNLGLDYRVLDWLGIYGSAGLIYESPAFRQMESPDPFYLYNPDLKPQRSKVIGLGVKTRFEEKDHSKVFVKANAGIGAFQGWLSDIIVPYEVYGDVFYRNASSGKRFAIKFDGMVEIIKGLDLDVSYTYSLCSYDKYITLSTEEDQAGNVVQVERDFSGNSEPGFPGHDVRAALAYDQSVSQKVSVLAKLDYCGLGGFWVDDLNSAKTDFYNVVDVMAGVDLTLGDLNISLNAGINNIFDCVFVAYPTLNSANYRFYDAGAPRNFVVDFNIGYQF